MMDKTEQRKHKLKVTGIVRLRQEIVKHRTSILVIAVSCALALGMYLSDRFDLAGTVGIAGRGEETSGTQSMTFQYVADGQIEGEINLDVHPVERKEEEALALLEEAADEWKKQFLGDNENAETVWQDLNLPSELKDGLVEVAYEISDYNLVMSDGTVNWQSAEQDGSEVCISAIMTYRDYQQITEQWILIVPPEEGSAEWIDWKLSQAAADAEKENRTETQFSLPVQIAGHRIEWQTDADRSWLVFPVIGLLAAVALEWKEKEDEKQRRKDRLKALEYEYPQLVDQMAMLLGSGMTIRGAWEQILRTDQRIRNRTGKNQRFCIEEMWRTYREMQEGCGEREAYERFGQRIGTIPYRRFVGILTQNLARGTRDVRGLLTEESVQAMELRKNTARRKGEEAGTKLLFPMLLMLVLILMMLLLPAMQSYL